ncbi:MAG: DNA polymerase III subunit alpha, partial [Muribaculaceae bacterium]|nr:DNA polymerase III subunit alpha [Muribaculaceae bacterium]
WYSWVAYQTAYLKAHYPAEYMAGVLSRNLTAADKLRKFMDECKRMGITVKGPDINESIERFGVNQKGEIRFGLAAVKGVGLNAVNAIISERDKNGAFKDIYDFVERVNLSACNRGAIENLAMAGAFDCFNVQREMFVHPMFDSTYTDLLVKYGQNIQNDKNSLQMSLFGELEPIETNKPPYPNPEPWDRLAILEKEKEMVMMYLSAHPLDPYYMELTYGCNTPCEQFKDKQNTPCKITMGGLVTKVTLKTSRKGNEFTIVELEDFTGKTEIALFGMNHNQHKDKFRSGEPTFLNINIVPGRFNPERTDMQIEEVSSLESKKGNIANGVLVYMNFKYDNREFFTALEQIPDNDRKGDLYFDIFDPESRQSIRVHSRKKMPITRDLMDTLRDFGMRFKISTL